MILVAEHRTTAKAGAQESASLEASGNTTVGVPPVIGLAWGLRLVLQ